MSQRSRTRSYGEASDEEDFVPQATSTPVARKRMRMTPQDETDDEDVAGPVLPQTYLRSPPQDTAVHQPGSIVRVKLSNFVTYTHAEFHPGPNLNMVIGPNGTGKSTLVCAICLGLGWPTKHLGRAKDVGEFVKHGSNKAEIEIELQRNSGVHQENPIITTVIRKKGNSSEFLIQGKKASMKQVQQLARSFSIQVDNLCQFLPQDRVVEFATLTPVNLLTQTQRAAAPPEVSEWHEQLKSLGKEVRSKEQDQTQLQESLKRLETRQRGQQADVERIREHAALRKRYDLLKKAQPFPRYTISVAAFRKAKDDKKVSARELAQLQRQLQPNLQAINDKADYLAQIVETMNGKRTLLKRLTGLVDDANKKYELKKREITEKSADIGRERDALKKYNIEIKAHERNIVQLTDKMKNAPPAIDFAALNAEMRDYTRQMNSINEQKDTHEETIRVLKGQLRQRGSLIEQKKELQVRHESQIGRQATKLQNISQPVAKAWAWLQDNLQQFSGPVFGPPCITCTVKDPACIPGIEAAIGRTGALAFTVTNKADYGRLQHQFHDVMHLSEVFLREVRPGTTFDPPCSTEELRRYGLTGWAINALEGPEEVLAMLSDNHALESVAYTLGTPTVAQSEALQNSPITNWFTSKEMSRVMRRRQYGDNAVTVSVDALRPAYFFVKDAIDHGAVSRVRSDIAELEDECAHIKNEITDETTKSKELSQKCNDIRVLKDAKEHEKEEAQRARSQFDGIPTKIEGERRKMEVAKKNIREYAAKESEAEAALDKLYLEKAQKALDHVGVVEQFRVHHMELLNLELIEIEASSDHDRLEARSRAEQEQIEHHKRTVERLTAEADRLKEEAETLKSQCEAASDSLADDEQEEFAVVSRMNADDLEVELNSTVARLDINTGGNANVLAEFERRAEEIERKKRQVEEYSAARDKIQADIDEVRGKWEPQLESIVSQISAAFTENFASIQCAGEVELYKDEDFEQWAIHIKVKFRESEPMSVLDSHRQSGGERAVSTIFYLMALQSLARAPFRVVDEINQGMDPRNERLVHSRLVQIACSSRRDDGSGGSQYFLITPKLLNGLEYHPNMKVHCIASGEHMPSNHASLDFGQLAQRALALRAM